MLLQAPTPRLPPQDLPKLAKSVLRYDLSSLANGVKKIFLYSMGDSEQGTSGTYLSGVTMDGSAHLAAPLAPLAWHVDGLSFAGHKEISPCIHVHFFEGNGRSTAMLAPRPDHAPFRFPADTSLQLRAIWKNPAADGAAAHQGAGFVSAPVGPPPT